MFQPSVMGNFNRLKILGSSMRLRTKKLLQKQNFYLIEMFTVIFRCLDKSVIETTATGQTGRPEAPNPWKLCRVTQVENAKIILSMLQIFCCTIIMTICLTQIQTFAIQQGVTKNISLAKSLNMPPASLPITTFVFLVIIINQIFVPFAGKITGRPTGITCLQLVGVSFILSSFSMAMAALMEVKHKSVA